MIIVKGPRTGVQKETVEYHQFSMGDAIAVIQNDEMPLEYFVRHRCQGRDVDLDCISFADAVKVMNNFINRY